MIWKYKKYGQGITDDSTFSQGFSFFYQKVIKSLDYKRNAAHVNDAMDLLNTN